MVQMYSYSLQHVHEYSYTRPHTERMVVISQY